ncbi:MAG: SDR family oxidoreductase, partial [Saccharopolyspora sp.]|uniref:type I polyketide synthase n=1 Tax=Saccharopolyspora sp. TaxID=33915 RepID=UPI0025F582AA
GGSGTLAPHVARWLAEQGAEHIVLTSRRGADAPGTAELVAELAELGTEAEALPCDLADRESVRGLLAQLADAGREVRTVLHTAAFIGLEPIDEASPESFADVLRAKVGGAQLLDELLDDDQLDAFVLFSSTAGLWGSGQHAAYVAGNAYLAALAEHRRARGLPATSISWGIWADDQKLGRVDPDAIRRSGLVFMPPHLALAGLRGALEQDEAALAVADVDWDRYHPVFSTARPTTLFDEIPEVRRLAAEVQSPAAGGEFAGKLRGLTAAEQQRRLLDLVRAEAATALGHTSSDALGERRAFRDVGFDSLTAVDLRNRIAAATGLALPTTMVFDHPNPLALVEFLRGLLAGQSEMDTERGGERAVDDEPIAIVGMSCRYPGGANTPEQLWDLVTGGADVISGFPADRGWDAAAIYDPDPERQGKTYSTYGGFLHDMAEFDAEFFGISPREALAMDPQQRLLLETTWELFERSGLDPAALRGTRTGAFIGASYQDYDANSADGSEGHMITGALSSILSGRLSYLFGLEGPAVTLDTACSSSLVALHFAVQSLRNGESSMALAGGVSVMSTPSAFVGFSRQRAMAPDGRCKAYSDSADGMSLAEGIGLVLVERLSDARANGHPVLAVVRGSAINQDGASNGLTAPNGPSQQRVIRAALADAGLEPSDVDAVEGHGTGTALGDPIEAQALLATYGQDRSEPLLLGSVKSNIGHTQMASGVAGVIKTVLALRNGSLPPTLHVDQPSSHVDWSSGAIELLREQAGWPETGRVRRAAVSSFGLSGTNAHTILEQVPEMVEPAVEPVNGVVPAVLSARSEGALRAQAARMLQHVEGAGSVHPADLAFSLATSRSRFEHRATVIAADSAELRAGLTALRDGLPAGNLVRGKESAGRLAFLFTGQGSQRAGAGRELYDRFPVFAEALDDVLARLDDELDRPLRDLLFAESGSADAALLDETGYAQPALFALEVALFRLVESCGALPDQLAGHSIGEVAAAHVAGVFSLEDACKLVAARGRLMQELPRGGAMIAVEATEDEVRGLLTDQVSLAAVNGPDSVVISGASAEAEAIAARLEGDGRRIKHLAVSHAFHSPLMEPMLAEFRRVAGEITYRDPVIPVVSNVTGALAEPGQLSSVDYWVSHVREAVRFSAGVRAMTEAGVHTFLELGPDGVLSGMARDTTGADALLVPALRRDRGEAEALTTALASLHVRGIPIDWAEFFSGTGARRVDLPTYAFQRERFWPEHTAEQPAQSDSADAAFWDAVERADAPALTDALDLDEQTVHAMLPALSTWRRNRQENAVADAWRYRPTWKPVLGNEIAGYGPVSGGTWLLLAPEGADAADRALKSLGADVARVEVHRADRAELAWRLRTEAADAGFPDGSGFAGVISLLALAEGEQAPDVPAGLALTTIAVQALGDA